MIPASIVRHCTQIVSHYIAIIDTSTICLLMLAFLFVSTCAHESMRRVILCGLDEATRRSSHGIPKQHQNDMF